MMKKKTKAIIERASDGTYSVYMDADVTDYLITGTGKTAYDAIKCFMDGYDDMKKFYEEEGKEFEELTFTFEYDTASFLSYYSNIFSLVGLSHITGINKGQLSHYLTGHRKPSKETVGKIQTSIREFAGELSQVCFI